MTIRGELIVDESVRYAGEIPALSGQALETLRDHLPLVLGAIARAVAALLLQGERGLPQLGVGLVHCAGDGTCQRGDVKVSMPDGFVNFQLLLPRTSREWVYRLLYCFPAGPRIGMPPALIGFQPHHSRKEQR